MPVSRSGWLLVAALGIATPTRAPAQRASASSCDRDGVRTRAAAEREIRQLEKLPARTVEERCALGALYTRVGQFGVADSVLRTIVRTRAPRTDALLALANLERRRYEFAASDRHLAVAARLAPRSTEVRLAEADEALARADARGARALYQAIIRDEPTSARAAFGLARVSYAQNELDSARRQLDALLQRDPAFTSALLLRASIDHEQQKTQSWRDDVRAALAADSLSSEAHAARAGVLRDAGDVDAAYHESLVALALDPFDDVAHGTLGNGGSITSYGRYPPLADDSVPPALAATLAAADSALARRQFARADSLYRGVLTRLPTLAAAMLGIGSVQYRRGQFRDALEWFLRAATAYPNLGIAHYGAAMSMKALRDHRNLQVQAAVERFRASPRPAEPERLRDVFPDYGRLDPDVQKVILLSVAPVRHYISLLATAGATFRLIPFERRLWEMPRKAYTRGTRTFDLRLWDDVKGQGGFHALSGEAWVRDAMNGRYNVLAHEFMHQVHGTVLTDTQRAEITRLFAKAKRERRTLDYYADFNEMEYFAQAYEAALSETKLADQKGTSSHTRAEVARRDPEVYRFIQTLEAKPATNENAVVATRQLIGSLIGEGKVAEAADRVTRALATYGEHAELLSQLGVAHRLRGDYPAAIAVHARTIAAFPSAIAGYLGLAEDYEYASRDYDRALATWQNYVAANPESAEGWMRFAGVAVTAGRLDEARVALARADSLTEAPNPYAAYSTPGALAARVAFLASRDTLAERLYRYSIEHVTRGDAGAWTDLAAIALRRDDTTAARAALASAQAIDREDARVREIEARLFAAQGRRADARNVLQRALAKDSTRLETVTALIAQSRDDEPSHAMALVDRGLRIVTDTSPVRFTFERDRFRSRQLPTMPAIAQFFGEAALVSVATNDTSGAIRRSLAAVRAFPLEFRSIVELVQLYDATGDCAEASAWRRRLREQRAPPRYVDAAASPSTGDAAGSVGACR